MSGDLEHAAKASASVAQDQRMVAQSPLVELHKRSDPTAAQVFAQEMARLIAREAAARGIELHAAQVVLWRDVKTELADWTFIAKVGA